MKELGDEVKERLRTFGLHGKPIPMLHVENIAREAERYCKEQIEKGVISEKITGYNILVEFELDFWQELKDMAGVKK